MLEQQNQSLVSRFQILSSYLKALEKEDLETANDIVGIVNSDARLKNIVSEINITYQQENSTYDTLKETDFETDKIRLAIIQSHYFTRVGIQTKLSEIPHIEVVGEASSYLDGLVLLQQQQPDVAIIDVDLAGKNGIELTRKLKQSNLAVKSLIMAKDEDTKTVLGAFAAGANSYCVKDIELNHLIEAIHVTYMGNNWIDPVAAKIVLELIRTSSLYTGQSNSTLVGEAIQFFGLTRREAEVLKFLTVGCKNADIANKLRITVSTVKSHITNLLIKLGASDRTQAVIHAMHCGLVHFE